MCYIYKHIRVLFSYFKPSYVWFNNLTENYPHLNPLFEKMNIEVWEHLLNLNNFTNTITDI